MPIPIAHPAAVLPLRRLCPKYLSFSALVVGSFAPDLANVVDELYEFPRTLIFFFGDAATNLQYVKENWEWDNFAHTFLGCLLFSLPASFVIFSIFNRLRAAVVEILPNPHRTALHSLRINRHPVRIQLLSLLIGSVLHIAWDSFTNSDRWLAQHWLFLKSRLLTVGTIDIELSRVLWIVSSLGGTAALIIAYFHFIKRSKVDTNIIPQNEWPRYLLCTMILLLPVFVALMWTYHQIHFETNARGLFNFFHRFLGYYLVCFVIGLFSISLYSKSKLVSPKQKA